MTENAKHIEIRTVEDIIAIPPEKMHHFLTDLALWCAMHWTADEMNAAGKKLGFDQPVIVVRRDVFEWIDDGKHIIGAKVTDKDGKETMRTEIHLPADLDLTKG